MSSANALHRRKSSKEDDVVTVTVTEPVLTNGLNGNDHDGSPRKTTFSTPEVPSDTLNVYATGRPQRQRVLSTPSHPVPPTMYSPVPAAPPSAGPFRASFGNIMSSAGPSRSSHSRNLSVQGHVRSPSASSFYPPSPSPLSVSFPAPTSPGLAQASSPVAHRPAPPPPNPPQDHLRRHSRIHSRNLSIYFPRPGAVPPASIAEDGAQELEVGNPNEAPETLIASAPLQQGRELQSGFTFGGRRPTNNGVAGDAARPGSAGLIGGGQSRSSRRGHHHKHSLSHNFFSFMEPGESSFTSGAPTPTPVSASFPSTPRQKTPPTSPPLPHVSHHHSQSFTSNPPSQTVGSIFTSSPSLISLAQFILGSALWVRGQQCGSLACTGLGYWVVFDAFGVACTGVLPQYLAAASAKSSARAYGNARLETLAVFAQSIYLIFTSVYVSKEAVEHMLLSHGEGHHHHRGDDAEFGIEFPTYLVVVSFLSLIATGVGFDNNSRLINATANRLPSLSSFLQSFQYASKPQFSRPPPPPPTTIVGRAASNPYTALPAATALSVMSVYCLADVSQHRTADLLVAAVLAVLTFGIAYPAALALAKVLLQTAPERGIAGGRMEAFLRAMRDLERHPHVLHLPPPHIWQLTPASQGRLLSLNYQESPATVILTLELHVRRDLDDATVLELTRWAWDRCTGALGGDRSGKDDSGIAEVTVGVVRG